jgi:hypothetical protein
MYILQESAPNSEQVPPEIQWVDDIDNCREPPRDRFDYSLLKGKFKMENLSDLSESQRRYGSKYFEAMVHPFKNNQRWCVTRTGVLTPLSHMFCRIYSHQAIRRPRSHAKDCADFLTPNVGSC